MGKIYACIDLKSFYASVECVLRNLDPLTTNLVVADSERTEKTICLAVSPSLKKYGLSGRSRLYEVVEKVKQINTARKYQNKNRKFISKSYNDLILEKNKNIEVDYIIAKPQMAFYMEYSTNIYNVYLKYFSEEDMVVYSIDEVFFDLTNYLKYYNKSPEELISMVIKDVYDSTGITATAGIGTNLFLAKVAMDVVAKHKDPNEIGVRIASLDEYSFRKELWDHQPITDIWRIGNGIKERLEKNNIFTLGDIAYTSYYNEDLLFNLFGINAELLIDHAWGYEPCTIKDIKSYKPSNSSLSSGQVLHIPYDFKQARLIVKEMADLLALDLVEKKYITDQIVLTIIYDVANIGQYKGEISYDHYGRKIPKHSHGTLNLEYKTSSQTIIQNSFVELYDRIVDPSLLIRKLNLSVNKLVNESEFSLKPNTNNNLFFDSKKEEAKNKQIIENEINEKNISKAILDIKRKYGKNAIIKGMNLEEYGTSIDRNKQIGGHHE